jgi:hypothetical protein
MLRLAGQAPFRLRPLSSNVRPHMRNTESEVAAIMSRAGSYAGLPLRAREDLLLSVESNFSLGVWSSWCIFQAGPRLFVRRIEWARGSDALRVVGEAPTTFGAESPLPTELAQQLLAEAKLLAAEPRTPEASGIIIDGVYRSLSVRNIANELRTTRWHKGSVGGEPLDSWLERAALALDAHLPASSARSVKSAA